MFPSQSFFGTGNGTLALWLDWGPVAFCVTVLPALWLLHRRRTGLATSIRLGLTLCTVASLLRLLPLVTGSHKGWGALAITHVAQVLSAQPANHMHRSTGGW